MKEKKLDFSGVNRFVVSLIERYCPFNIRTFELVVGLVMVVLLSAVLILGWLSSKKTKEVVTEDFNQQQSVIARHAASQIENILKSLKREMTLLSFSPSVQYAEIPFMDNQMEIVFSKVRDEGGIEIRFVEEVSLPAKKSIKTHVLNDYGYQTAHPFPEDLDYLKWARERKNKGAILISDVSAEVYGGSYQRLIIKLAVPVWKSSADESHPVASNRFSGVLLLVVDTTSLTEKITKDIRSGKTGYTWVIDSKGVFLYHPEKEFIGKNAFEARKEKQPMISFEKINAIQSEKMMKGEEGTSWYISGWHRGDEGKIRKLIAYSPIRLNAEGQLWSVAVVAPSSEVEDAIHSIHIRQISLQAVIIIVILVGGLTIITLMVNWSKSLEEEVKKQTAEVKKSEQRYKSLVENAEDVIFTVDYDGNYLSINRYGAKFFNRNIDDIVGKNMLEILEWPGAEIPLATIKEVFDTKTAKQITHVIKVGDHEYWLNTNFRRLFDKEGNLYAVLGISRNITAIKEKEKEEEMHRTEKLASIGTLAAGVAHEINNPLAIILGFTDLLEEKFTPDSEEYDMLKTIEKHGNNAKRVVENLLNFARYKEYTEELLDINENIMGVLDMVENTLNINNITVKKRMSDNLPRVQGSPGELQEVYLNIINNAIHAMKGGGVLTISTRALDNGHIEIRLSDTGCGIKREHKSKIFDPLFTTKKVGEGTGLGMSVSYGIVTKHGGTIDFETRTREESEDSGTTFIITLPAVKTEDSEQSWRQ